MTGARQEILERIAAAVTGAPETDPLPRGYRRAGTLGAEERTALFCVRVGEYRAEVERIAEADVAATVESVCSSRGVQTLAVPVGVPDSWRPAKVRLVEDTLLSPRELDALDGTLTGCTAAVAETGTIVLTAGPREGRRALTLVPDVHICVVRETQIVELLPEALALLGAGGFELRPITFISGPSATSDIERSRVEGVHGPRNLVVLVVTDALDLTQSVRA